jgi:quinol monooxygenase YgiN
MAVTVVARMTAKPGMEARVREELTGLVGPTRAEDGCLNYDLHESADRPGEFLFHENWASEAHLGRHLESQHLLAWRRAASTLLAAPVAITLWKRIG